MDWFETYFLDRADLADELARTSNVLDSCRLATTALDALGEILFHDFPDDARALGRKAARQTPCP